MSAFSIKILENIPSTPGASLTFNVLSLGAIVSRVGSILLSMWLLFIYLPVSFLWKTVNIMVILFWLICLWQAHFFHKLLLLTQLGFRTNRQYERFSNITQLFKRNWINSSANLPTYQHAGRPANQPIHQPNRHTDRLSLDHKTIPFYFHFIDCTNHFDSLFHPVFVLLGSKSIGNDTDTLVLPQH